MMAIKMNEPTVPSKKNSWYLKTGFTHHFLCRCGQVEQYSDAMILDIHHPDHCCSQCENTHYLDSVMFLNNPKVTRWSIFNWNIEKTKTQKEWIAKAYASIPVFNYALQKIEFKERVLAINTLLFSGEHTYDEYDPIIMNKYVYNNADKPAQIKELMAEELEETLYAFVLSAPTEEIAWIQLEKICRESAAEGIKLLSFFLEHSHLKEYDFFYWNDFEMFRDISKQYPSVKEMLFYISNHRNEKSIKKAYFESYERSMKIHSRYDYKADYLFARQIEDRNFLLGLIQIDPEIKYTLFNETELITLEYFFNFLMEHYAQKAVTKLFTNVGRNTFRNSIIRDTIWMYRGESMNFIKEHFRKVPLNFVRLHDEFIRINALRDASLNGKIVFEYHDNDKRAQTKINLLEYRLPETVYALHQWSQQLSNCMYGYSTNIHKGESLIYGVFKDGILTYAVEIRRNKIVQALGKHNSRIEAEDREDIDKWFREAYINAWMRSSRENSLSHK